VKTVVPALLLAVAFAVAASAAEPGAVDRAKLRPLHEAGQAFDAALADPAASAGRLKELRHALDEQAVKVEKLLASKPERYIYDLYSTAAGEYGDLLARFEANHSKDELAAGIRQVREYLRLADRTYGGGQIVKPSPQASTPPPAPAFPPAVPAPQPESEPAPAPPPQAPAPAPKPQAQAEPEPAPAPTPQAPAPAPKPQAQPEPAPAPAPPPPAPAPTPTPQAQAEPAPAPAPTPPAPAPAPTPQAQPEPAPAPPPPSPVAESPPGRRYLSLNDIRHEANRVRFQKKESKVAGCRMIAQIEIPPGTESGVIEIAGHNFFYGSAKELARFKTVLAGGDTFLIGESSRKAGLSGTAYRCE
jgi:hypothetical protein